jgi:DNA invertase Pin-like site-specific DNA recombinase
LIPAVGYARRSTNSKEQEKSIPEQIDAGNKYAAERGYHILRWYVDDGISGDATEERADFLRMMEDAHTLRDFKVIVSWDQARFGRFDSIELGYYVHPLRKAGVTLATVQDGVVDWNASTDRIVNTVKQEGKHQQLLDHAHNVTRGQLAAMKDGSWVGSPPYGYDIVGKKKSKRLELGDAVHVGIVKRIFKEFTEDGRSMTNIASRLNEEGYPSPGGTLKGWRFDSVQTILGNPAYTGDFTAGKRSYGKYHTVKNGSVSKAIAGYTRKPKAEWIVIRDHHDHIIDRPTFERAQAILANGKAGRSRYAPAENPYVLSGLLRCGRCGYLLRGMKGGNSKHNYYVCGLHFDNQRAGRVKQERDIPQCPGTTVREDMILHSIADHLDSEFLSLDGEDMYRKAQRGELTAADVPKAFAALKRIMAPPKAPAVDRKAQAKRVKTITAQIDKAVGNLVLLDPENIPAAQDRVTKLREERTALEADLQKRPPSEAEVNAEVMDVLRGLYWTCFWFRAAAVECGKDPNDATDWGDQLNNGCLTIVTGGAKSPEVRRYLRQIAGIDIHTRKEPWGKRTRHVFERGEIRLTGYPAVTGDYPPARACR